jgi:tetratricopeptide (TPR) repeat protein
MTKICLGMIVRNEAHVIERAIKSARPYIHSWCVVDTGSEDGTQEVVKKLLGDLPGELYERPWRNFAENRTELFQLASKHGDYMLSLDADDTIEADEGFEWPALDAKGYQVTIMMGGDSWRRVDLLRCDKNWHYEDVIHSHPECSEPGPCPGLVGLRIRAMPDGHRRTTQGLEKYEQDCTTLERELEKDPENARYQFYYAQSLRDCHRFRESIEAYKKRAEMGGWAEECWFSLYQAGRIHERLDEKDEALALYLSAYELRPARAESLVAASALARKMGRHELAMMFSRQAKEIPRPNDRLFLTESAYRWRALDEFAISAYWSGRPREAQLANKRLLKLVPPHERARIERNLAFCERMLAPSRRKHSEPVEVPGKRVLFVGCGRSGTGYLSKVLSQAGIPCGHEKVFGPFTRTVEWGEYVADSSWLAVPWLATLDTDVSIVHVSRDPLLCSRSWAGVGTFADEPHPYHGPYRDVIQGFSPGILALPHRLARIIAYWTVWNEWTADYSDSHLEIEKADSATLAAILDRAEVPFSRKALDRAVEQTPKNVNTRIKEDALFYEDMKAVTPPALWERFVIMANRLGYDVPDESQKQAK